ncbi:DUF5077 domain-containing protein, partial [Spirosoma sp.]|uniref:DUF5077 domain-containing protein n=1 Tax=Spirosoma sp. TaxID=1899569 RepID=UPI003B3B5648
MNKLLLFCWLSFWVSNVHSQSVLLPVGGNAWILERSNSLRIRNNGTTQWREDHTGFTSYIRVTKPGSLEVSLENEAGAAAQLSVSILGDVKKVSINGRDTSYLAGE